MTITTYSADNVFKKYYLSAITDQLNMYANPFLARIKQSENYIQGKEIKKLIRFGMNGGVTAGTEDGDLPATGGNCYAILTGTLKNLYGRIEITDKAIRASQSSEGAFVNLLNDEMEHLVKSASYNMSRMLFGNGSGLLGKVVSTSAAVITVEDTTNFTDGMLIDLYSSGVKQQGNLLVKSVDRDKNTVTVDKSLSDVDGYDIYAAGARYNELTGLGSVFSESSIYGLSRTDHSWLKPYTKEVPTLTEEEVQLAIDKIEEKSGSKIDTILCSWGVRRALIKALKENHTFLDTIELDGGYKAVSFNGIPVLVDRFCPKGTMYLLNSEDFTLHQLCDWQWLEDEDGKVLRQIPGKAIYSATLVKYADLMCDRPFGQGRLTGIAEA